MAEKTQFSEMDPAEVLKQLDKFTANAAKTSGTAIGTFAKFQEQRAGRLNKGLQKIKKDVGEGHPAYLAVKAAAERTANMNMQFKVQAVRLQKRPIPKDFEWMVFGQVLDEQGNPAAGLTVRVFDRDRKYDDLLGETETDENGDFSVVYHERDFTETGEKLPELYIMVSDATGKLLHSSRDNIRFEAGKSEYFSIRLGKGSRTTRKKDATTGKTRGKKAGSQSKE